jgi:hypothetical protein
VSTAFMKSMQCSSRKNIPTALECRSAPRIKYIFMSIETEAEVLKDKRDSLKLVPMMVKDKV